MTDPRQRAADVLARVPAYVWDGASLPVPVEAVADTCYGLLVRDVTPEALAGAPGAPGGGDLSGLLLVDPGEIWVNAWEAGEWPGRRRFTIGHELGHWELHRPTGSVFCRKAEVGMERPPVADIEEEASLFSSGLMFPPRLVREHHAALGEVGALADRFGASRAAMERAICFAVRAPLLEQVQGRVAFFHHDDDGYVAWRDVHRDDGFVLNDDLGDGSGCRLHRAGCSYLLRAAQEGQPRTRHPKWCSLDLALLRELIPRAVACGRCL